MDSNVVFFGWNRPISGREQMSAEHFNDFMAYLGGLKSKGSIQSFDAVLLGPHGGDLNGFFLIRGQGAKLNALTESDEWVRHMTRAALHLEGAGAVRGQTGELIEPAMKMWKELLPR